VSWCCVYLCNCPVLLPSQRVTADATLPETGSAGGLSLLKGSFSSPLLPAAPFMLRAGDWIKLMIQCNSLVSLARQLFMNRQDMSTIILNLTEWDSNAMNWAVYNFTKQNKKIKRKIIGSVSIDKETHAFIKCWNMAAQRWITSVPV